MKYLFRYLATTPRRLALYMIIAPVNAAVDVGLAYIMAIAIEFAMAGDLRQAGKYTLIFICYILLSFFTGYFRKKLRFGILRDSVSELQTALHKQIFARSAEAFAALHTADYISKLTNDVEIIRDSLFNTILGIYTEILELTIAVVAMLYLSPILGVFAIFMAVSQLIVPLFFTKRISTTGKAYADAQKNYMVILKENLAAFSICRLFHLEAEINQRQSQYSKAKEVARVKSRSATALSYELSFAVGNGMFLGIYLLGAVLALKGHIRISAIVAATQLMTYIASPLTTISEEIAELKSAQKVSEDLVKLLQQPVISQGTVHKADMKCGIRFRNVSFSYNSKPVLNQVNYSFQAGKKYLITGDSGSGKSTFLAVLAQLYQSYTGSVFLDDVNAREICPNDRARLIACIPQTAVLLDGTVADNVRLFGNYSDEMVLEALDLAGLHEWVQEAAAGIHTQLGENASEMSGGERQRLAIARALIRKSPVLLMDESTSNLDAATAQEIEKTVFGLSNVMVLFVTHHAQPSTYSMSDCILQIRDGRLFEKEN